MAKFIVEEIREIVSKAEIQAKNAHEALFLFKKSNDKSFVSDVSEDVHTIVKELEER